MSATADESIGHLLTMDESSEWSSPILDFAYSSGFPRGASNNVKVHPLVDDNGEEVLCKRTYTTCQGIKICPFTSAAVQNQSHSSATHKTLKQYLHQDWNLQQTPAQDVFEKTVALCATFLDEGCPFDEQQPTERDNVKRTPTKAKRGQDKKVRCRGRIVVDHTKDGNLFVRCEHYGLASRKHLANYDAGNGLYNEDYLVALLQNNNSVMETFERKAAEQRLRPTCSLSECQECLITKIELLHCGTDNHMVMTEMKHQTCESKFTVFEPQPIYRSQCLRILIVCRAPHSHLPPLPTKTPALITAAIMNLLYSFQEASQLFLVSQVLHVKEPTFIDLHPSLGNLDHLGSYIYHAQDYVFPEGTGWKGLLCLKAQQDATTNPSQHYIRVIREYNWPGSISEDYEELEDNMEVMKSRVFKLVLCMFPQRSWDLLDAQFIQSDISHKRIAGFKEFALLGLDRRTQTILPYCCLLVNSSSAEAHRLVFAAIREQVPQDTGKLLQYQHIHSSSLDDCVGILHWVMDQDQGQAKGLGLHLQEVSASLYSPLFSKTFTSRKPQKQPR
ncbi:hypothetical protein C8J56DRAFT_890486 [Mycena floridula]|nr:hypothetical protein C8J56DRAFT_890486 [Mycena floridula]